MPRKLTQKIENSVNFHLMKVSLLTMVVAMVVAMVLTMVVAIVVASTFITYHGGCLELLPIILMGL